MALCAASDDRKKRGGFAVPYSTASATVHPTGSSAVATSYGPSSPYVGVAAPVTSGIVAATPIVSRPVVAPVASAVPVGVVAPVAPIRVAAPVASPVIVASPLSVPVSVYAEPVIRGTSISKPATRYAPGFTTTVFTAPWLAKPVVATSIIRPEPRPHVIRYAARAPVFHHHYDIHVGNHW